LRVICLFILYSTTHNGTNNFKEVGFICHANILIGNTSHISTLLFDQIMALKQLFVRAHYIFPNISTRKALEIEHLSLYRGSKRGTWKGEGVLYCGLQVASQGRLSKWCIFLSFQRHQ
jgi:hypothetical protein